MIWWKLGLVYVSYMTGTRMKIIKTSSSTSMDRCNAMQRRVIAQLFRLAKECKRIVLWLAGLRMTKRYTTYGLVLPFWVSSWSDCHRFFCFAESFKDIFRRVWDIDAHLSRGLTARPRNKILAHPPQPSRPRLEYITPDEKIKHGVKDRERNLTGWRAES